MLVSYQLAYVARDRVAFATFKNDIRRRLRAVRQMFAVERDGVGFSNRILRRISALHHARQPLRRRLANKMG